MGSLARFTVFKSPAFMDDEGAATYDDEYENVLEMATGFVEKYTARNLISATYTDQEYPGVASNRLWLREWPVSAVTEVKVWDGSDWTALTAAHYGIKEERYLLYPLLNYRSAAVYGNWRSPYAETEDAIKVSYTAGYKATDWKTELIRDIYGDWDVPMELELAVCEIAHILWTEGKGGGARRGLTSVGMGGDSISIDTFITKLPSRVRTTLDRYRRLI